MSRAQGEAIAAVLTALSVGRATRRGVEARTGLPMATVSTLLTRLCTPLTDTGQRRAHIAAWHFSRGNWCAIFEIGHGENAPKPVGSRGNARRYERESVYQRQRREQRPGADLQAAWHAPLPDCASRG
ncbi:MAG: hypothetical protein KGJ38_08270 [Burkholderiaceae bacterium]|nr:hypothetical protein [Burkholderiaceae bacterium]